MYSILIVEDEAAASRYLRSIVETKCPAFQVLCAALDGAEGLEMAKSARPDVILTDIKMAGMDGLEFALKLKEALPSIPVIIISGFQEFEYARRALGTGVTDYLLKPVNPRKLAETLEALIPRLNENRDKANVDEITALARGADTVTSDAAGDKSLWLAVLREGGLPSRFHGAPPEKEARRLGSRFFAIPGRDERETVFVAERRELSYDEFVHGIEAQVAAADVDRYRTLVFLGHDCSGRDLPSEIRELCRALDSSIVLGTNRTLFAAPPESVVLDWESTDLHRIDYCLANHREVEFGEAIGSIVSRWKRDGRPLFRVEIAVRRLILLLLEKSIHSADWDEGELEYDLDALVGDAEDWDDFEAAVVTLARRSVGMGSMDVPSAEAPAFFLSIRRYVEGNYARALSLSSISEGFGISKPYLTKLFRKHLGMSFNEFLTHRRIEAAKRLIRESPTMPIKDVAQFVGISDPFYFSRVFKSIVGTPPSEF